MTFHRLTTACFTFLLLSIFSVLASASVPHEIVNGFFNGRSGDVLIAPKNLNKDDSFLILKYSDDAYKTSEIDETELADLISHLVGTTPVNLDASRSYFPEINLFQRPKANLFIAFDSVGEDEILQAPELNFLNIGQKIRIVNSSYPRNSISKLTTLLTGKSPSTHGIVSESWISEGDSVRAYSSQGLPFTANFPDILSQTFNGRSLTLALSGNFQLASSSSVHRTTLTRLPFWNNYVFYWNSVEEFVDSPSLSLRLQNQFMITRSHLLQSLSSSKTLNFLENSGITARYLKNSNSLQVILKDRSRVDFDLNNKEIISFFIEVELVQILMGLLQTHSPLKVLIEDESPDHFSIIFSSLTRIKESKGKDSMTFKACLHILDQLVSQILSSIENAYDNRVVTQLVFLGNDNSAQLLPKIQKSLAPSLFAKLASKLPQIYLTESNETLHSIEEALSSTDFKAYFFPRTSQENTAHWRSERAYIDLSEEILAVTNQTNKTHTYIQVATFHICLWTPIVLAILLFGALYFLSDMSSQDSTLYRSTQVRHAHQS